MGNTGTVSLILNLGTRSGCDLVHALAGQPLVSTDRRLCESQILAHARN